MTRHDHLERFVERHVHFARGQFHTRRALRRTKRPMLQAEIALRAGRIVNRFKVAKHFELLIADRAFHLARQTASIERESQLDGTYVIRTSEPASGLSADDAVRDYKPGLFTRACSRPIHRAQIAFDRMNAVTTNSL